MKPNIYVFTTAYAPFIGGAEVAISEVIQRLRSSYNFIVFTARLKRELPPEENHEGVMIIRIGLGSWWDKLLLPFWGVLAVRRCAKKHSPALYWGVMVTFASGIAYLSNLLSRVRVPIVLTLQEGDSEAHLTWRWAGIIGISWLAALHIAAPRTVTGISAYLVHRARRLGYSGKTERIPNGVDLSKFKGQNSKVKIANQNAKVIVTTSRLVKKNGVDTLIQAVAEVKKVIPSIQCYIIGDGTERGSLERQAAGCGLRANIKFFGEVPHKKVPEYLHEADVFVRASRSEGMGNSFVEALAAGLPIIGTPVGGILDIIEDGKTGLFARVDDPADLAEKIIRLLRDEALKRRIVAEGIKMVEADFGWDGIAEHYKAVFQRELKKVRMLITTGLFPPEIGGPATYSKLLLDELPGRGFEVEVFPFREVRHMPYALRHIAYCLQVLRRGWDKDVMYAQDAVSIGFPTAVASILAWKPLIVKVVGDHAWEQGVQRFGVREMLDEFLKKRYGFGVTWIRFLQTFTAYVAEDIVVPSKYLAGVARQWGVPERKIHTIYNSVDIEEIPEPKEILRKRFGFSSTVVTTVGRLVPWKGHRVLLEAIKELLNNIPDIRCVIIGSGPEEGQIRSLIETLDLRESVVMQGSLSHQETLLHLKASDVFILNSGYEGLPHVLIEAMSVGVPVIATRVGGNPEVVEDNVNGILISYNHKEELKVAIKRLQSEPDLSEKFARNAEQSLKKFERERMIQKTIELLTSENVR
ncbi:MAG: glycosyltransferase family 4 protein [Candidatus Sungbacteria bacterium]|nr:glycosyltransferase family 4 protein [Candidatus Sungbacteria bacterium]